MDDLKSILNKLQKKKEPTTSDLKDCLIQLISVVQEMSEEIETLDSRQGYQMSQASKLNK